jgi:predicted DNA-binding transcriptional regulator AlpA
MINEYSVILTYATDAAVDPDKVSERFSDDVTVSFGERRISVAGDGQGATVGAAVDDAARATMEVFDDLHIYAELVEVDVMTWEQREASIGESNFPDIVSAPEVAEILGVTRQRVHQMISETPSFPPPLARLGSGPIWLRSTIEAYSKVPRRAGRPRSLTRADIARIAADDPVKGIDERATQARVKREQTRVASRGRAKQ